MQIPADVKAAVRLPRICETPLVVLDGRTINPADATDGSKVRQSARFIALELGPGKHAGVVQAMPLRSEKAGGGKIVGAAIQLQGPHNLPECRPSPRVTADVLDRYSMDAAHAWSVVIEGKPGPRAFNYQVQLVVTPKGTWVACWTQGTTEAAVDQRVVVARSLDGGRSWSSEIVVEEAVAGYRVPAWGMPFVVPSTGRVYVFYWFNYNGVRLRDAGDVFFRFFGRRRRPLVAASPHRRAAHRYGSQRVGRYSRVEFWAAASSSGRADNVYVHENSSFQPVSRRLASDRRQPLGTRRQREGRSGPTARTTTAAIPITG